MISFHLHVFKDSDGEWRWNAISSNGNIIADSSEGYHNRQDCLDMMILLFDPENRDIDVIIEDNGQ